ncbi:MAG: hypothetical protein ACK5JJ_13685 [Cyanobacteriota bacterium]
MKQGDRISQELADALLAGRLERDCRLLAQRIPLCQQLSVTQQAARLSGASSARRGSHSPICWRGCSAATGGTRCLRSRPSATSARRPLPTAQSAPEPLNPFPFVSTCAVP